ncbi:MAG TPA: YidC/Oxa1 family membrane protein insertase [Candidatus Paceibacterota bacterium]
MFELFIVEPLYNLLVFLLYVIPGGDAGAAIILLTILVRCAFFPAFSGSIRTQLAMQKIQGELDALKKKFEKDPQEKARRTMELMRANNVRPFASIGGLVVQLIVFIGLYTVLLQEGLPSIEQALLYPFTPLPSVVDVSFLWLDLTVKGSIILALLVAGLQFLQGKLLFTRMKQPEKTTGAAQSPEEAAAALQRGMQKGMMLYLLPVMLGGFTYAFPAATGIYFATNSVFSIVQELYIARKMNFSVAR